MKATSLFYSFALSSVLAMASCGDSNDNQTGRNGIDDNTQRTEVRSLKYTVEGRLDMDAPDAATQQEVVTWANFPANVGELADAQRQIGNTLGGAVALQLMAFEIYRHDRTAGEEAVRLVNHKNNVQSVLSVISQRYNKSEYAPDEDLYVQPYIVASFLDGATTANRYTPNEPYRITVYWDADRQREEASAYSGGGFLYYVHVVNPNYTGTPNRSVQVVRTSPEAYCLINNSPSLYTQCPPISGTWTYQMK